VNRGAENYDRGFCATKPAMLQKM